MKKYLFAVIAIVSLLCACGGGQSTNTPEPTQVARATNTPEATTPPVETEAPAGTDVLSSPIASLNCPPSQCKNEAGRWDRFRLFFLRDAKKASRR